MRTVDAKLLLEVEDEGGAIVLAHPSWFMPEDQSRRAAAGRGFDGERAARGSTRLTAARKESARRQPMSRDLLDLEELDDLLDLLAGPRISSRPGPGSRRWPAVSGFA